MLKRLLPITILAVTSFAANLPRPAGEVPFEVPGKGTTLLSSYKGKVVMIAAILTTCQHCQSTTPILNGIQRDLGPRGLQIIQLVFNDRDNAASIANFKKQYKPGFPVGIVEGGFFVKWAQLTPEMRPTVPMVFIVDRDGMLQAQYMGGDPMMEDRYVDENLRAKLMQYLIKPAPSKAKPAAPAKKK